RRYWRADARASQQSPPQKKGGPMGVSSPLSPPGYPDPSPFSWGARTIGDTGYGKFTFSKNSAPLLGGMFIFSNFFRVTFSRLGNDVLGHRELADVVQNGGGAQGLGFVFGQAKILGQFHGVDTHPLQVLVGGMVLGFNRQRQRFNRAQVKIGYLFHVTLLV